VWALVIGIVTPCGDQLASMAQIFELVFVQAFVPEFPVKTLDEAALHPSPGRGLPGAM